MMGVTIRTWMMVSHKAPSYHMMQLVQRPNYLTRLVILGLSKALVTMAKAKRGNNNHQMRQDNLLRPRKRVRTRYAKARTLCLSTVRIKIRIHQVSDLIKKIILITDHCMGVSKSPLMKLFHHRPQETVMNNSFGIQMKAKTRNNK